ncbi:MULTISPECIES: crotonase/enoyl-CoA hydratase family protein [unclassified Spongiibacter]|jgi:enoyl-CoA hydratase|uniref:crotonase/enoyl-CoA hydratase family protein n=1 Tax=Spongiibacter TaxID=630749 RepID=UPI000C0AF6C1|nr:MULTISPECIES: crotonase/enoyl-CoA hydratase family protein [unclassified Spongiibacter]MAK44602.1 enoyl-CoA hydratase [Spongiibacter sp.]|tara:strand:- start:8708 stop:9472 length:765 start_codon:yes stop_codon:yes gene_type:complete
MANEVIVAVEDGVMLITINRPEAKNSVNLAVAKGIAAAMEELDSNDEIRAAILTGAEGTFCSGMDLKAFVTGELPIIEGRGFAGLVEAPPRKPLIAAVEGFALAGGFELAISCDMIVSAGNAKFGIPEVKRGLVAGAGGLLKLPRQIPRRVAMELALTGDAIDAQRAYDLGLINRVVEAGTALAAARELADKIAANGPMAVLASKQIMNESEEWSSEDMFKKQNDIALPVFASKDAIEGATAFAEKRPPQWKGC